METFIQPCGLFFHHWQFPNQDWIGFQTEMFFVSSKSACRKFCLCLTKFGLQVTDKVDRTGLEAQVEVSHVLQRYSFSGYMIGTASLPRQESSLLYILAYRSRQNSLTTFSFVACVRRLLKPYTGLSFSL